MIELTSSLSSVFRQEDVTQQVVEVIKNLGVCSAEYVEADDLAGLLKPIEFRKFMACIKCKQNNSEQLINIQFHIKYTVISNMYLVCLFYVYLSETYKIHGPMFVIGSMGSHLV